MVQIRDASLEDFYFFYELKSEESNIFWTGHACKPNKENLFLFFSTAIENAKEKEARKIYIVEDNGTNVGCLYIIPTGECFDLVTAISDSCQGRGYGKIAIALGLDKGRQLGYKKMRGSIREDNIASMKAYAANGVKILQDYKMVYIPKLDKEIKMYFVEKDLI